MASLLDYALLNLIETMEEAEYLSFNKRKINLRDNPFEISEKKFVQIFRLDKSMVDEIICRIDPFMTQSHIRWGLDTKDKVLAALRFFASGSHQLDIALNKHCAMSQSSISKSINEVINAFHLSGLFEEWVRFPRNKEELNDTRLEFMRKHRFPGVVGCIDCTHVGIFPPNISDTDYPEHIYVNRKGWHSINVQLVCNSNKLIRNVNARYPGSTGDAFIWKNSNIRSVIEIIHQRFPNTYYLLGDSGYPLRPWLLTPLDDPVNIWEENYNKFHKSTRTIIEHVNGILKMRFRCLLKYRTLHYKPEVASKIINVCCALHNMCVLKGLPDVLPEHSTDDPLEGLGLDCSRQIDETIALRRVNPDLVAGRMLQKNLIVQYFSKF